jgi:hypothetical protein
MAAKTTKRGRPKLTDAERKQRAADRAKRQREKRKAQALVIVEESGPRPMSPTDYRFCAAYVQLGKAEPAYRQVFPEAKYPGEGAQRMLARQEIRDFIRETYRLIHKERDRAAAMAARASLLTCEMADDRLAEILQQRRRTRGEMLTRDVKTVLLEGAVPKLDENGRITGYDFSPELATSMLNEGAPVEDADLLKAVKLTYDRRQGIIKPEKQAAASTGAGAMLYKPRWFTPARPVQTLEGT